MSGKRIISTRKYNILKKSNNLTEQEQREVDDYLESRRIIPKVIPSKQASERTVVVIDKLLLWKLFIKFYEPITGREFKRTPEALNNIEVVIKYFAADDSFFQCVALVKNLNKPSFSKGLLIIGMFGNGKTSFMETMYHIFKEYNMPLKFKKVNANDLVAEWESIETPGDKSLFFEKYTCKYLYIDDVKKERMANNFGKVEIVRDILEKRHARGLKTFITCNFREDDHVGDLNDALREFNRYGNHIYDRLFQMFNIIVFTGKSQRQ